MQKVLTKVSRLSWGAIMFLLFSGASAIFGGVVGSNGLTKDSEKIGVFSCAAIVLISAIYALVQVSTKVVAALSSLAELSYKKRLNSIDAAEKVLGSSILVPLLTPLLATLLTWTGSIADLPMNAKACFVLALVLSVAAAAMLMIVKEEIASKRSSLVSLSGVSVEATPEIDLSRYEVKKTSKTEASDCDDDESKTRTGKRIEL